MQRCFFRYLSHALPIAQTLVSRIIFQGQLLKMKPDSEST
jgi:hypothetical protein